MENETANIAATDTMLSYEAFRDTVLADYSKCILSREASLMGRREVLTGKAKFGVFSDGKEVAQTCMAKFFMPGDFRAGYYRDQTFMLSSGLATLEQFFAELYADANPEHEPFSSGRQMVELSWLVLPLKKNTGKCFDQEKMKSNGFFWKVRKK